jgi:protoheme ferro-lyase
MQLGWHPVAVAQYTFTHKQYIEQYIRHKQYIEQYIRHKQYIEQYIRHKQYIEQHISLIRKSADRASSLRVIA